MKTLVIILLLLSASAFSGKVYISSDQQDAKKVYITNNRSQADMFVYFVSDQNEANETYLWFKVDDRNNADMIIHYVEDENRADLIIYVVDDKNSAGWNDKNTEANNDCF